MEIHFLGTGAANPGLTRGASSLVIRLTNGSCWMFDCGEGTQTQLMKSVIKPGKLDKIFITHLHGDHVFGLPGLLCTISLNSPDGRSAIHVYGPKGLGKYLITILTLSCSQLTFPCVIHELCQSDEMENMECNIVSTTTDVLENNIKTIQIYPTDKNSWNILNDGDMTVSAAILKHRVICFGYVIQETEKPGSLNVDLLKSKGISPGPLYAKIKRGEILYAKDGSEVKPEDVLGPPCPGRKVVVLGDTCDSQQITDLAMNADVLIHEATNENAHKEKCIENGHSTPDMAVSFAKSIQAKKLILTHFSQRYKAQGDVLKPGEESIQKLLDEAKKKFDDVTTAHDLLVVNVPKLKATVERKEDKA